MTRNKNEQAWARLAPAALALAAMLAMGLVWYATAMGPGVGGDATIYLTSARGLLEGRGLGWVDADGSFRMLPYTPPFYPLALSAVGLLTIDMLAGARWLNIFMFGALVYLIGAFFTRATGRVWLAVLLAGTLAVSPVLLGVQVWAMSESLFLLLGFAGLMALLEHLGRPRPALLVTAAVLCGLALLTRYIGVAFVAAGGLALLLARVTDARENRGARMWPALREGFLFGLIAIIPILTWLLVDFFSTGTVGSRSAQPASAYWQRFLEMGPALEKIVLFWLVPESVIARLPGAARVGLWLFPLAALIGLAAVLFQRLRSPVPADAEASTRLAAVMGLFILVYLAVLAVVQVFTYPPVTLASRMLSPVHLAVLVLVFTLLHLALNAWAGASRAVLALVALGCLGLFASYALRGALVARDYHNIGIGYMAPEWQQSNTLAALRGLDPSVPIISNETTAVMFFLNRPAYALQEIYQREPEFVFTAYGVGDDPAQRVFREQGGALVLFRNTLGEDFERYGERTEERIRALTSGLFACYENEDGGIYFSKRPDPAIAAACGGERK